MEAREIIEYIGNAEKKTPVKVYVKEKENVDFEGCKVFGSGDKIVFGDWKDVEKILAENADKITLCAEGEIISDFCRRIVGIAQHVFRGFHALPLDIGDDGIAGFFAEQP